MFFVPESRANLKFNLKFTQKDFKRSIQQLIGNLSVAMKNGDPFGRIDMPIGVQEVLMVRKV